MFRKLRTRLSSAVLRIHVYNLENSLLAVADDLASIELHKQSKCGVSTKKLRNSISGETKFSYLHRYRIDDDISVVLILTHIEDVRRRVVLVLQLRRYVKKIL